MKNRHTAMMVVKNKPTFALLLITILICNGCHGIKNKPVSVNLESKWDSTPLLLEASEFMATENNDMFWSFISKVVEMGEKFNKATEQDIYTAIEDIAVQLLSGVKANLLTFALSLRTHSPTVQMFNQLSEEMKAPDHCVAFIDVHNMITCESAAIKAFVTAATDRPKSTLIKSDHIYMGTVDKAVTVILYAQLGTPEFLQYHTTLRKLADDGQINYVLRHYIKNPSGQKVRLSGYGVELAIKSTEYKAKDDSKVEGDGDGDLYDSYDEVDGFVFSQLQELYPEKSEDLKQFKQHLVDASNDLTPLKQWQLQDLSFQAGQMMINAPANQSLEVLRDVSQNFPIMSRSLLKTTVKDELRREIKKNQQLFEQQFGIIPGDSVLFINGLQADLDVYDVFSLLDTLLGEAKIMEGLYSLGIQNDQLSNMMKLDLRESSVDYAVDTRNDAVVYINNLESDRKYNSWPHSVQDLLRPTFPGMLRHIRKNMFNLVFFVDPTESLSMELLKTVEAFYVHSAPIRLGMVLLPNSDPELDGTTDGSIALCNAFNFIKYDSTVAKALSFVTDIYETVPSSEFITAELVMSEFSTQFPDVAQRKVFAEGSKYDQRQSSLEFYEDTGLDQLPQVLVNGGPLKRGDLAADNFEEAVVHTILKKTTELQRAVYDGKLTDKMDMEEYIMDQPNVMPRLNARVLQSEPRYLDLTMQSEDTHLDKVSPAMSAGEITAVVMNSLQYFSKKEEETVRTVTEWIVTDVNTVEGRDLLYNAIKHMKSSNDIRISIIHNPKSAEQSTEKSTLHAVQVALDTLPSLMAKSFITKLVKEDNVKALANGQKTYEDLAVNNMDIEAFKTALKESSTKYLTAHRLFCERVLNIQSGQRAVVANGMVVGPLRDAEIFITEDFALLEKLVSGISKKILKKIDTKSGTPSKVSDIIARVHTLLMSVPQKEGRKEVNYHTDQHSVLNLQSEESGPAYDVVAILDPTTRAAQKYTPLIMVLQQVVNTNIKIFLNCKEKLSELPLKSFYRYVLDSSVSFSANGNLAQGPQAKFNELPHKALLTLGMDPPEGWLVEAVHSPYDLDNIYLTEVDTRVHADFELEYLLVEGHCYDSATGQPPRGLQFVLGSPSTPAMVDTIVMANLGYFQLKAKPGAWNLSLRHGRSQELYDIFSHEYTDSPADSPDVIVVIDSFKSKIIKMKVKKKLGREKDDLLAEDEAEASGGLWNSLSSQFTGGVANTGEEDQTLNIFSLASGHLYERFLRIMMLSVLKHTNSPVKFWFLKNYLSPTFTTFIPHMAEKYNFDYELVQYKWPRWLHQQTEKQRIIWGYKILFLDVLFPLDVNKIVFVDADQIVRTDLLELFNLDLEGAPYGYTPFCESRTEMDGFRFWKSGYWAGHLGHRKYHISALYVVDLKKFRKIAAGDRLRGQYQGLSQDPNSLSNLDQDLPNNMIHQVAIKSLPQEWLWCETWCSTEELKTAKTIDLCNNPRTKEPKLQAAMRIVPEWVDYDNEVKSLWDEINAKSDIMSHHTNTKATSDKNAKHKDFKKKTEL